jgi:glc operon protein GlcG
MNRAARLFISALLMTQTVFAQAASPAITADAASKIIGACVAHAKAKKQSHAIAVSDEGGRLLAFLRMDGNASGIGDFAIQKAEAVASWRFSTAQMAVAAGETPGFADAPHVVIVPGGLPVFSADGRFLGAVGVSGEAPKDDSDCAEAGIKAAGFSAERVQHGS